MRTHTLGLFLHHLALSNEVSRLSHSSDRALLALYEAELSHSSDRALLALYEAERCEPAFTELMRRHGPMVLRVCRRVLGHGQDAEDAFQATFLLLARRTGQLLCEAAGALSLGGWLHRVAYRTALNATAQLTRRKNRERQAANMPPQHAGPEAEADWNEVRPILDAELDALPEEPRRLLIACYLQSKTHAEAATELGVPLGSMAGRLEKAKVLLATRLARRGIIVSAPFLAACLGAEANGAIVPARLLVHSVEAAVTFAEQVNGAVSGAVARLVKLGLANGTKTSTGMGLVFVGSLAVLAAGLIACQTLMAEPHKRPPSDQPPEHTVEPAVKGDAPETVDRAGDALPQNALARMGTVRYRTATGGGGDRSVHFTTDGQGVITAGGLNPLCLWDTRSGKLVRRFGDHVQYQGQPIALTPDGKVLAGVEASSGHLCLWDVATGKVLSEVRTKIGDLSDLAFSADGKSVASIGTDHKLRSWDVATGRELWVQNRALHVRAIVYGADGKTLIAIEAKGLSFWDAATGQKAPGQWGSDRPMISTVLSPDRGTMAVVRDRLRKGADHESDITVVDLATLKEVRQLAPNKDRRFITNPIQSIAVASGGTVLAEANGAGEVRLWDLETGKELRRCQGGRSFVDAMTFSADGKLLAGLDRGRVRVWETASGQEVSSGPTGHECAVSSVAFLPDGSLVSNGRDGVTRIWDSATGAERTRVAPAVLSGSLVPVGETSAVAEDGKTVTLLDLAWPTEQTDSFVAVIRTWDRTANRERGCVLKKLGDAPTQALVLSPDGRVVVCAGGHEPAEDVYLWEAATGKQISKVAGRHPAISADGKWLATVRGREKAVLTVWDVATGKELGSAPVPNGWTVAQLVFAPHGQMVAAVSESGAKTVIHLWSLSPNGAEPSGLHFGPPRVAVADVSRGARELAFSPDGRMFALPGDGGSVRLLETATGRERMRFSGQVGQVQCLAFSADGRRLATGSSDTTILIWDVTGRFRDGKLRPAEVSAKEREGLWTDLASDNATRAGRGIWVLAADPLRTVPFLAKQLKTTSAQTAPEVITKHIRDLDDPVFAVREKAHSELKLLGELAEPALRSTLKDTVSAEVQNRAEGLLKVVEARKRNPSGVMLRGLRAIEVLEQIGTPEARAVLKDLSAGPPGLLLTRDARMALSRLDREK